MTTPCEVVIYSNNKEQATQIAKMFYKLTNKTFDITIATIKPLYSNSNLTIFHQQKEKLLEFVGSEHFEIKKNKIFFHNQFTKIDLGGIVKEYAVDQAIQILKKRKITSGLINFGGDIYALGKKPNGEKFNIGIKDPLNKTHNVTTIELENMALTTSANYERNYQIEDQNFSHIINPHNYTSDILSATVISPSTLLSGIYSTSLICNDAISSKYQTIKINKNKEILYENFDSRR